MWSMPEEQQPHNQQHWKHERNCVTHDISQESRRVNMLMIRDGLHHEVRSVADVSVGAKEDRANATARMAAGFCVKTWEIS